MKQKILIFICLICFSISLHAQSETEKHFYKIKEYYSRVIPDSFHYFDDIPLMPESRFIMDKKIQDSGIYVFCKKCVSYLKVPIKKIIVKIPNNANNKTRDSLKEVQRIYDVNMQDIIAPKEANIDPILDYGHNMLTMNKFSNDLADVLFNELYVDSTLENIGFIEILSLCNLSEEKKQVIIADKRATNFSKAMLGHHESVIAFCNEFWDLINQKEIDNIYKLEQKATRLLILKNDYANREFLKALQSENEMYGPPIVIEGEGIFFHVTPLAKVMITSYNRINYFKLNYFERYVRNNPKIPEGMRAIYHYDALSYYFQDEFKQEVKIQATSYDYDTNTRRND